MLAREMEVHWEMTCGRRVGDNTDQKEMAHQQWNKFKYLSLRGVSTVSIHILGYIITCQSLRCYNFSVPSLPQSPYLPYKTRVDNIRSSETLLHPSGVIPSNIPIDWRARADSNNYLSVGKRLHRPSHMVLAKRYDKAARGFPEIVTNPTFQS